MIKLIANLLIIFLLFIPKVSAIEDLALPTGPQVTEGEVTINNQISGTLNINQISSSATIEWTTFNVGSKASVYFNQPTNTSSIYNDVRSGRSIINGKIYANGKLFLHNPSGIYLGPYSAVQGQGIVLSTLNLLNKNSQTQEHFYASQSDANLETQGLIEAGYVTLISSSIKQLGTIKATGDVQLAASDEVYLKILPNSQLTVKVEPSEIQTALDNQGGIISSQGQVFLKSDIAQSFVDQSINHSNLQATELVNDNGVFKLVSNSGNIKANNIQLSSGKRGATNNSGVLDASTDFDGGIISIEGNQISIQENSILNATGKNQGGQIKIGGDWQGQGSMIQAETTSIDKNTTINASSLGEGDGGTIVVWSDIKNPSSVTSVKGDLIASAINGQGGNIETSGYHLDISSVNINASSDQGADGLWLIDPVDFTIASSGGDMTGSALTTSLASASVTILSSGGSSGTEGDININDAVTWSANKLTLNANNNIYINADLLGSGSAQLDLLYGQGAVASGNTSDYSILKTSSADSTSFSAQVTLADGNNFSTTLGSDGSAINYQVISDLNSLKNNASGNFALGANVDASGETIAAANTDYCGGLRCNSGRFAGNIDGLGHTIDSFTSNVLNTYGVGLFSHINGDLTFRNIGLTNRSSTSGIHSIGGFVGRIYSGTLNIINSYSSGTISGLGSGGFVGKVEGSSTTLIIKNSVNHINITNGGDYRGEGSGGFVGYNAGTLSIINSFNSGDITGNKNLGGLVGYSNSSFLEIDTSYNTGNISNTDTGDSSVGGLVAQVLGSNANIHNSYNTGAISSAKGNTGSNGGAGGIVGHFNAGALSKIQYIYNTGAVAGGRKNIGGIVGVLKNSTVDQVYNTGAISGTQDVGGIVGYNSTGYVTNAYNTGQIGVSGVNASHVGGVVGRNDAYVQYAYGSGMVYGGGRKGAVIGVQVCCGYAKDIYGDNELTGIDTHYYLGGTVTNANNFTTAQMKDLNNYSNFSGSLWLRFDSVNSGYPILSNNSPVSIITFTAADLTKTYGESLDLSSFISNGWYSISGATLASAFSVNPNFNLYDNSSLITDSTPNAGSYSITPSGGTVNSGYLISYNSGTLTVNAKSLTVSGITASNKTYDGNTLATIDVASASYTGLVDDDSFAVAASGVFNNKNVGTDKTVALTSTYSGDDIANYSITNQSSTSANIVQLSSVTWTGDGEGDTWSTAANWTSSAIPDNNNVAAVVIPANASVEYDADNLGVVGSTITNMGTLTFTGSTDLNFPNVISGTGSVIKSGTGSLTLSGANTFSGGINYGSSTLIISNSFAATSFTSSGGNLSISPTLSAIDITGPTTISSDITTTGTQRYQGNIIVASGSIASPVEFSNTNADIIFDGTLKADATGKSRSMTFDAGTANLIFNDRIGYNFNTADFDSDLTADSFYKMIFNAGSITVKGDVMTFEEQVYNGPVIIGSNNNGVTRTLLSMDPAITFNSTVNDTIANTHNLIAKAVEVRRVGEVATTPVVTFASYVGNNISLASHQGLTGYQIIDEKFGNIDTSIDFGTVNAAPTITTSNNSSSAAVKAKKAKKAASNAVKSLSPIRTTSGSQPTMAGPSIKLSRTYSIDISYGVPAATPRPAVAAPAKNNTNLNQSGSSNNFTSEPRPAVAAPAKNNTNTNQSGSANNSTSENSSNSNQSGSDNNTTSEIEPAGDASSDNNSNQNQSESENNPDSDANDDSDSEDEENLETNEL